LSVPGETITQISGNGYWNYQDVLIRTDKNFVYAYSDMSFQSTLTNLSATWPPIQIARVSQGVYHMLLMDVVGTLFSRGRNSEGQLALGDLNARTTPTDIVTFRGVNITQFYAGLYTSFFIASNGSLWGCGYNLNGNLGTNDTITYNLPQMIAVPPVKYVYASSDTNYGRLVTFVVTWTGNVFGFGQNDLGVLGIGTNVDSWIPVQVTFPFGDTVATLAANAHALFVNTSGSVYSCGFGSSGQLGHGTLINLNVPKLISGLSKISQVYTGSMFSMCSDTQGALYAWGDNQNSELGFPDSLQRLVPAPLTHLGNYDIAGITTGVNTFMLINNQVRKFVISLRAYI
jgi:alpha-tubulin suppressor-like RCC1 family protein